MSKIVDEAGKDPSDFQVHVLTTHIQKVVALPHRDFYENQWNAKRDTHTYIRT